MTQFDGRTQYELGLHFAPGADVSGNDKFQNVSKLQGNAVQSGVNTSAKHQFNIQWKNSNNEYEAVDSKIIGGTTTNNTLIGGLIESTVTITTSLTLADGYYMVLVNTGSAINITLPPPVNGRVFCIKDINGAARITLVRNASEKIEGVAASRSLITTYGKYNIISNGTDWFIIT